jgi:hypothetical protein
MKQPIDPWDLDRKHPLARPTLAYRVDISDFSFVEADDDTILAMDGDDVVWVWRDGHWDRPN